MLQRHFGLVVGIPTYAKYLAALLNEHSSTWTLRAFNDATRLGTIRAVLEAYRCDAIICFGGPSPNAALAQIAHERGIPVIVIWSGSDVQTAELMPKMLQTVRVQGFTHISDCTWLSDELRPLGIDAAYVPVTAVRPGAPVVPFAQTFRVLTYLPEPRRDFYGRSLVYELAHAMADVPFWVVGRGRRDPTAPGNVTFYGFVRDTTPYIDGSVVFLRMPQHDGKSMFVLEAMARARHVIWNHTFPHVQTATCLLEARKLLRALQSLHASDSLPLNHQARTYALEHFGRADIAAGVQAVLDGAHERARQTEHKRSPLRIALSGPPLLCASLVQAAAAHAPEFEPRFMPTASRLQVLTALRTLARSDLWYAFGSKQHGVLLAASRILRKPQVVHAESVPVPVRYAGDVEPAPLPKLFTILLYVPREHRERHGIREYERLMREFIDRPVQYYIVGGGHINVPSGIRAQHLGWRADMREVFEHSTVLVRFTRGDAFSQMVVEALSLGRYVIWTQSLPHVAHATSVDGMRERLSALIERHRHGALSLNTEGRNYVLNEWPPDECMRNIARSWSSSIAVCGAD